MKKIIYAALVVSLTGNAFVLYKYFNLKSAYHRAEKEKVELCQKYNELYKIQ